jgi:hypothetical protein
MHLLFLPVLIVGLVLGVWGMLVGVDRRQVRRRAPVFNLPTLAAGLTLFGAVGYPLTRYTSLGVPMLLTIAGAAAVTGAVGMFAVIAAWALPSARRVVEDERFLLQGFLGRVTRAIRSGEDGEIVYEHNGRRQVSAARGVDDRMIEAGTEIVIERVEGGVAYVQRWSTIERSLELPS